MLAEFDPKYPDILESLKRAREVLALTHVFLSGIVTDEDAWELNRDAFSGMAHVLSELKDEIGGISAALRPVGERITEVLHEYYNRDA